MLNDSHYFRLNFHLRSYLIFKIKATLAAVCENVEDYPD